MDLWTGASQFAATVGWFSGNEEDENGEEGDFAITNESVLSQCHSVADCV